MRILVLGSGAREHALAWHLAQHGSSVWLGPGNGLAELDVPIVPCRVLEPSDVLRVVRAHGIGLVIVGAEAPLLAGVADALADAKVPVLGPKKDAAMLEGSKAYAKTVMQKTGVPTAAHKTFSRVWELEGWLSLHPGAHVVKASGLMAGKGVTVCDDATQALDAGRALFAGGEREVLVEQRLLGKEASLIGLTDGKELRLFPVARDHKRLFTGDLGKNTGGMGAYCPVALGAEEFARQPVASPDALATLCMQPVLDELRAEGRRYRGFLYAGLMFDEGRPYVIEYNARLGDPEAQVLLTATDGDWLPAFYAAAVGELAGVDTPRPCGAAVCVVLAARGYPDAPEADALISGVNEARRLPHVRVFGAGVRRQGAHLFVSGGRVLSVVGHASDVATARARAYAACDLIHFDGMQRRLDIAGA